MERICRWVQPKSTVEYVFYWEIFLAIIHIFAKDYCLELFNMSKNCPYFCKFCHKKETVLCHYLKNWNYMCLNIRILRFLWLVSIFNYIELKKITMKISGLKFSKKCSKYNNKNNIYFKWCLKWFYYLGHKNKFQ